MKFTREWKIIKSKLPEKSGTYLCMYPLLDGQLSTSICEYNKTKNVWEDMFGEVDVVYWTELPPTPKLMHRGKNGL